MGLGNPWPCPGCCDVLDGCFYFSDDFNRADGTDIGPDWDEVLGDWELDTTSDTVLATNDDDAIAKCNTNGALPYVITVTLLDGQVDDEYKIFFNYTDEDNHSYLRCDDVTGTWKMSIVTVSGGVPTTHITAGPTPTTGSWNRFRLCVHSDRVYAEIAPDAVDNFNTIIQATISTTSGTCGLGTGTIGPNNVGFTDFSIQTHDEVVGGCPKCCDPVCSPCTSGPPCHIQVAISGVIGNCPGPGTACASFMNGTFILVPRVDGGADCDWEYSGLPANDCNLIQIRAILRNISGSIYQLSVGFSTAWGGSFDDAWTIFDDTASIVDCNNWNFSLNPVSTTDCQIFGSSCVVTAL